MIPENIFRRCPDHQRSSFSARVVVEVPRALPVFMGNVRDGIRVTSEVATLFLAAAVVGTTTSLAAQSAAADGSP